MEHFHNSNFRAVLVSWSFCLSWAHWCACDTHVMEPAMGASGMEKNLLFGAECTLAVDLPIPVTQVMRRCFAAWGYYKKVLQMCKLISSQLPFGSLQDSHVARLW